jgi:RHS repeat-associated protein
MQAGLQYLRARYYEPGTGRFLTRDSYLGNTMNPLTLNRYDYTGNNPVMNIDPSGHMAVDRDENGNEIRYNDHTNSIIYSNGSTSKAESSNTGDYKVVDSKSYVENQIEARRMEVAKNDCEGKSYIQDNNDWMNQPAKKDIFDKYIVDPFVAWVTGEKPGVKTQGQQVTESILISASLEQQSFLTEYVNDLIAAGRAAGSADRLNEILDAASDSTGSTGGLFRKTTNTGDFKGLNETMQLKNVNNIAKDAGIGLDGIKVKIVRDPGLVGKGIFGYADPNGKSIQLYPDAFSDTETLVKILGHERMHIYQFKTLGPASDSEIGGFYELGARASEQSWWQYFNYNRGGK